MNVPQLPPQFAKIVALMESTTHEPERDTARRKAEALLTPDIGGFDRALRILAYQRVRERAGPLSFMAGFDEFTEIDSPGHMARQAAERAEKRRQQDVRRAVLVAEFGNLDAVLKPCAREKAMLAAVRPWRVAQPGSRGRWTKTLAGLSTYDWKQAPAELIAAIEGALPLPTAYAEAVAEVAFRKRRNDDMELAVRNEFRGDSMLDMPTLWRWWIVEALAEHKIELRTLPEIIARMRAYRWSESGENTDIEDAILRDLDMLAAREGG